MIEDAVFHDSQLEDAMLRRSPQGRRKELDEFVRRCRELREKLDKAQSPDEVDAINAELDRLREEFFTEGVNTDGKP